MESVDLNSLTVEQLEQLIKQKQQQGVVYDDADKNGKPKNTLGNFQQLLAHYNITIRYNEMSKETEIDIPGYTCNSDVEANAKIAYLRSLAHEQSFPVSELDMYIIEVSSQNSYHPVRNWIDSITWDGIDRLNIFYNSIVESAPNPLKETLMRKWALSAVASLYHTGFSAEGVLTLSGDQGIGKTSWVRRLVPSEYRQTWVKEGVVLDTKNKDSVSKALKNWIVELGELDATFKRSDIEALKGFITDSSDVLRNPYERKANKYRRQTVFFGSVNPDEFLRDDENRRYWVLNVKDFDYSVELDLAQFWAQVKALYFSICNDVNDMTRKNKEYGWYLSPEERQQLHNTQTHNKVTDPIEEILSNNVLPDFTGGSYQNCTEILQHCGIVLPTRSHTNTTSKWLKTQGYTRDRQKRFLVLLKGQIRSNNNGAESKVLDWRSLKK